MLYVRNVENIKPSNIFAFFIFLNIILLSWTSPVLADKKVEQGQTKTADYGLPTNRRDGGSRGGNDYGLPTHRRDGGSRNGTCIADKSSNLVALIPEETVNINASASSKLFFYVPKVKQQKTLEFVLRNEQDELIYEAFLTTQGDGIISVDIPVDLQTNLAGKEQNHRWYLSLICNSQQRSRDIVVEGWMRQSEVDLATKKELELSNSIVQAELYHERGFWYDALSALVSDRKSIVEQPKIAAKWSELLESVGLEEVATKSFVDSQVIDFSY